MAKGQLDHSYTLFELCLFWYSAQSTYLWDTLYIVGFTNQWMMDLRKKNESQYPQAQFRRFWHKIVPKDPFNTLVGSLMRVVKLSSSSSWTAAAVPKIKARLRLPTSTMKPPPQKLASNLCLHPLLSVLEDILISYFSLKTFEERIIQLF